MNTTSYCFVGIDVSKASLDVSIRPLALDWSLANPPNDIASLVQRLKQLPVERIIVEATGSLETILVSQLAAAGLPVFVINPRQARDFARATGQLAKTDRIDAKVLAQFAEAIKPELRPIASDQARNLEAILVRRRQLVNILVAEKNRLAAVQCQEQIARDIKKHIQWLERRVGRCDSELEQALKESPVWRAKEDLLKSVPGIGEVTSRKLLVILNSIVKHQRPWSEQHNFAQNCAAHS